MKLRARPFAMIAAAVFTVAMGLLLLSTDALSGLEHSSVDARFDLRGEQKPRSDVVVVAIDDKSIAADPSKSFPFNRRRHARVIRQLNKAGASVIAYDVQFTQPSADIGADNALILATRAAAPHVIMATTAVDEDGETAIFGGDEGLEFSRATPGFSAVVNDSDGTLRHMPPANEKGVKSVAVGAAELKLDHEIEQPEGAWIDFPGPADTYQRLSFVDVERGNFPASAVRGKIVIVGATSEQLRDIRPTSTSDVMPAPEVHAAAIDTALDGFPLRDSPGWVGVLLVVALGLVAPLVALRFGGAIALAATVVAIAGFLVGAQIAFNNGRVVQVAAPIATAVIGAVVTTLIYQAARHPWFNAALDWLGGRSGMNLRTRRLRTGLLLGAALLSVVLGLGLTATNGLRRLDLGSVDMRFDVRGAGPTPDDVIVVGIDDPTLNVQGYTWPFSRVHHAKVIRNLAQAGAAAIAYDVQFTQSSPFPRADKALVDAVRAAAPRVVMSATAVSFGQTQVFNFNSGSRLKYSRAHVGFATFVKDPDGVTRHMAVRDEGIVTFPVAAAQIKLGRSIAAPPSGHLWIDYAGPPDTVPELSFIDVEQGKFDPADVRGKVVVVGSTATALQDLRTTSTTGQQSMSGPEVNAHAILTALEGFPLHDGPGWLDVLLVVVLGTLAPFAAIRLRMVYAVPLGIVALAAVIVGAQLAFENDVIIQVVYALVAGVAALLATGAIHGVTVAFERANTRDAFARFVPESVVDQVLQDAEGVRLGGVRGEATVMFSDLRGFTSFAETLQPEQVIDALNRYLTAMSEAILDHGGTLVAYMGDGIMAVFGAPLQQDDHADRALAAARDMLARLEGFNGWLRSADLHQGFKMGIGLNTGPVMSGNVGSERRLEYTALGDTTNTAARLEGMTKGTPHQLYVADSTRAALRTPADDLVEVGDFEVRGRKAKIKLWSLPEPDASPTVTQAEPAAEADTNGSGTATTVTDEPTSAA